MSVISYWEVMLKSQKGLLDVGDPSAWRRRVAVDLGADVLSLRSNHVSALRGLPDHHKDPFDRVLIAQAITGRLVLVASEEAIRKYPLETLW